MLRIATKYPSQEMMDAAIEVNQEIDRQLITVEEFTAHWRVSYSELAQLANTNLGTVKHWFGSRSQQPNFEHLYRLSRIHHTWLKRR